MADHKITKKDLQKVFWRHQTFQWSFNWERMQNIGWLFTFIPILKKLYGDKPKEQRAAAMKRHLGFFNSQLNTTSLILGVTAALEEQTAEEDKESVISVKTSMMGPMAGLGDSLLKFTWLPIVASIGASLALEGNVMGPILMFILFNLVNVPTKYGFIFLGYQQGSSVLAKGGREILERITNMAGVIGCLVIGGMVATSVSLKTPLTLAMTENPVVVQELLDKILPRLLPALLVMFCYGFLKKTNRKHLVPLLVGVLAVGTLLAYFGILA